MVQIVLLVLIPSLFYGQKINEEDQRKLDSLNSLVADQSAHDTIRSHAYVKLGNIWAIYYRDTINTLCEKSLEITNAALKKDVSPKVRKRLKEIKSMAISNLGTYYKFKGDYTQALLTHEKALQLQKEVGFTKHIGTTYANMANVFSKQGDIVTAIEYYDKALRIDEQLGNKKGQGIGLHNMAAMYVGQNEYDKAIDLNLKALKIRQELNDPNGIAYSYNNLGLVYYYKREFDRAIEYHEKALSIRKENGYTTGMVVSLNNIGLVYLNSDRVAEALTYFKNELSLSDSLKFKMGIIYGNYGISLAQEKLGKFSAAEKHAKLALKMAEDLGSPELIRNVSIVLSRVYEAQGRGMDALKMYRLNRQMNDSIRSAATEKATAQQQARYEYDKKKAIDDAEHEKQLAVEQSEKEKQRVLAISAGAGLLFVLIFLIFVFNRLKITKRQKKTIEEQKVKVELAHTELEVKNKEILDSISYAKRIQSAILPPAKVVKEYLQESFILYKPKDIVAGDFYWMETTKDAVLFAAADCTGHGVPGAMVSVVCNNGLNRSVREHGLTAPGDILDKTREIVVEEFEKSEEEVKDGMDIALCSLSGNTLKYAGAHNPLWIIRKGEIIETKANKQPIGQFDKPEPYTTHSFELQKGDTLYIFSDGYIDQFGGEKGKKLKAKAFKELLLSVQDKSMEEQHKIIDDAFEQWKGNLEQIDDVCVIGVRI